MSAAEETPSPGGYRRRTRRRGTTISVVRITKDQLELGRALYPETGYWKPTTRADCAGIERPCPFVGCKHNLYLDVNPTTGSIKLNFPDLEPWEMEESCALDVAERCGITFEEIGEVMNLTRERIRQVELSCLDKIRSEADTEEIHDLLVEVDRIAARRQHTERPHPLHWHTQSEVGPSDWPLKTTGTSPWMHRRTG